MNVAERIARAGNSKNLTLDVREGAPQTDADVLIACGWTPTQLGRTLGALRSEWDGSAKPMQFTETDAFLLLGSLKSLGKVVVMVEAWATKRGLAQPDRLSRLVVAYWLENTCYPCFGRGHEKIPGSPSLGRQCRKCGGTGKRKEPHGQDGKNALNMMDACATWDEAAVGKHLRDR